MESVARIEITLTQDGRLSLKTHCPGGEQQLVWMLWKMNQLLAAQQPTAAKPVGQPILLARGPLPPLNGG